MICSSTQNLCTDHNHKTGFIRGRLCNSCNVGIGCFKDSSELLLKARNFILEENLEKLKVKHQPGKCYMFYKSFVDKCIENIKLGFEYGK